MYVVRDKAKKLKRMEKTNICINIYIFIHIKLKSTETLRATDV